MCFFLKIYIFYLFSKLPSSWETTKDGSLVVIVVSVLFFSYWHKSHTALILLYVKLKLNVICNHNMWMLQMISPIITALPSNDLRIPTKSVVFVRKKRYGIELFFRPIGENKDFMLYKDKFYLMCERVSEDNGSFYSQ